VPLTHRVQAAVVLVLAAPVVRGRQRRWTRWYGDSDAKWKRHYRFNVQDIAAEHNGNVVRKFAAENEYRDYRDYRDDGHTWLSERTEEALLTALLGAGRRQALANSVALSQVAGS
jgi:hypothetical protein